MILAPVHTLSVKSALVLQRVNLLRLRFGDREIYGLGLQDAGWPMQGNGAQ